MVDRWRNSNPRHLAQLRDALKRELKIGTKGSVLQAA